MSDETATTPTTPGAGGSMDSNYHGWEQVVSSDLSGVWLERDYYNYYVSIQLTERGLEYEIWLHQNDSSIGFGTVKGLGEAVECAEAIALQWELERHREAMEHHYGL